ncbi:hypothetical protein [Bartonella sp. AP7XZML]|uniref:hypothetical protein n=1 Tax=Bartonella sp. AP7XZML TaxID=3243503 RepID=UPI0035D05A2F
MNDLLVNITPEHYERYATEGTSPWNAYLMERVLEEASGVTSAKKNSRYWHGNWPHAFQALPLPKTHRLFLLRG